MHDILTGRPTVSSDPIVKTSWFTLKSPTLRASVEVSRFAPAGGTAEVHLMIQPTGGGTPADQLADIERAYAVALEELGLEPDTAVLRRWYCSDLVNQAPLLEACPIAKRGGGDTPCAVSWIGQPAVPGSKFAVWAYHVRDPRGPLVKNVADSVLSLDRGDLVHHWTTGLMSPELSSSYSQTNEIFSHYTEWLADGGMTLLDHVIRTWLFVQDIDTNYGGLVVSRRKFFERHGLTGDTHYIASSGIEGRSEDFRALVMMDAYAVGGVRRKQIEFLNALDHLGPTQDYGVTFERGTSVAYRDRKHLFLSGTASIDPEGTILHEGNVRRQLDRTLENMDALLAAGGGSLQDMNHFTVYLRDPCDHALARGVMRERYGDVPMAVVVGPVCRPGWLIELEGVATIANEAPELPEF